MSARTILNPPINLESGKSSISVQGVSTTGTVSAGTQLITPSATIGNTLTIGSPVDLKYIVLSCNANQVLTIAGLSCPSLFDSNGTTGSVGQVPTANGLGGWLWTTP
jgi:hypothetical protein